jgi:dimethylamine/trimethylamine dehydrogenase
MNRTTRVAPISPSGIPWMAIHVGFMGNLKPRSMDRQDIRDVLRWQAEGARKARQAGFDTVSAANSCCRNTITLVIINRR